MRKLNELVEIRVGYTFRSAIDSFGEGDTEVIQAKDLGDDFAFAVRPRVVFPGNDKHLLQHGDVLVSARGCPRALVYRETNVKAVASSSILVLRPKSREVSPEFIATFFNSIPGMKAILELSSGASILTITKDSLGRILIPELPPDKERALGELVQTIDDYRAILVEKQIYLDGLRTTIISKTLKETTR